MGVAGREGTDAFGMTIGRAAGGVLGATEPDDAPAEAPGAVAVGVPEGRGARAGAGREIDPAPAAGIREGAGVAGARVAAGASGSERGIGTVRDSGARDGRDPGGVEAAGGAEIFGAAAEGVALPGRLAGGIVWVMRSVGIGAGRAGVDDGASPEAGRLPGRLGFREPPPEGTVNGRESKGAMPMRSTPPPEGADGGVRETSGRFRTDSGGRESWTGTEGRYTATSAGRPPEGLGRDWANDRAAAGLFTSRSSVRRISSRVWRWTSSRVIPLLMITVLLLPRMFTFWVPALDVVAWHGNYAPYKYDLRRYSAVGPVLFDHADPSIFTVLTSPSETPGTANIDFVIFPDRWMVAEDTFRPPWYHMNVMSEFMGLIYGQYDAKPHGFVPGGFSLHNMMLPHGPDVDAFEHASTVALAPKKLEGTMAFMFETRFPQRVTAYAAGSPALQRDYARYGRALRKHFTPDQR